MIHRMGRGGRKSENQKFRVNKIGNLGYKTGEMEPQLKLGTYLSSRWSWRSESSVRRWLRCFRGVRGRCFLEIANAVVDVKVEEKRSGYG